MYAVAEIEITDPSWVAGYVDAVTRLVEQWGGRYLARTTRTRVLEGDRDPPQVMLLIEWPSEEAAMGFYDSDGYRPYRERRIAGARTTLVNVPGEDVAGLARMGEEP